MGATLLYSHGGSDRLAHDERRQDRRDRADGRSDQGPGRAGRRRRPLAEHAHGLREEQGQRRLLRQDVPHGPLLVGHAQGTAAKEYDWMQGNASDHDANNDNMWCNNPEETAAFMETVEKPWVAFKVMAAGAIHPQMAFSVRLPQRGRFHHRRHVRLPGRSRCEGGPSAFPEASRPRPALVCLSQRDASSSGMVKERAEGSRRKARSRIR